MEHSQQLCNLLDKRWNRITCLLGLVEKLVDLQFLEEVRLSGLNKDRALSASLIKDIFTLDILKQL
jgi:hypothetical protein